MGLREKNITRTHCNNCKQEEEVTNCVEKVKGDTVVGFSLRGKMKVLKKIKRRMGLVSRSASNGGTNNLPPLLFHNSHGENIRISKQGAVARRVESFCKGITFSSRPVKVNEKICVKFLEISNNWSGVIRFGFTYNDPATLRYGLPKYACPDLTNKPGYWAKALPERLCSETTVLFYHVTSTGDVHFGINGEEKGIFFSGVETRAPLWALIDVYGNSTAIEFLDIRHQLNNNSRRNLSCGGATTPDDLDRIIYPMQQMQIQQQPQNQHHQHQQSAVVGEDLSLPLLRFQAPQLSFNPMMLHRTRGRNVRFGRTRDNAFRTDTEFCQGYVFTARPLMLGERVVVQVLATEPMFQGCLGLGLTSCDPATLETSDLPDDSNFLLDRPEYWVLSRDFSRNLNKGDEISFCISANGEVQISRNGDDPIVVIHVDQTLRLWAFFDIYGSTQRVRVLSCPPPASSSSSSSSPARNVRIVTTPNTESMNSLNAQSEISRRISVMVQQQQQPSQVPAASRVCCVAPADIQVQPATNGGTVLSVVLPASHGGFLSHHSSQASVHSHGNGQNHPNQLPSHNVLGYGQNGTMAPLPVNLASPIPPPAVAMGTMISTCSSQYVEPISDSSSYSATPLAWAEQNGATMGTECTICYEKSIDAVLYMCGHMCMCYECALQQWRGKGGGHCPLCRAVIRDVIRTYKS